MERYYSKEYELRFYEVDQNYNMKINSIADYIGDIGTKHSESVGDGLKQLLEKNMGWVFYQYEININKYPRYGEKIVVRTKIKGFKKFYAIREYQFLNENGEILIQAQSIFLLIDLEKRKTIRVKEEHYKLYGLTSDYTGDFKIEKVPDLKEPMYSSEFKVRYSDIDINKHVNNAKYIEWSIESLPENIVDNYSLDYIKITFEKECGLKETINSLSAYREEDEDSICTIHRIETKSNKLAKILAKWHKKS